MSDQEQEKQQEKVREIVHDTKLAMLTTVAPDGRLVSKPMATQDTDFDGTVWFISERHSDKARNVTANPRVNVSYSGSSAWLSLSGTAEVVDDPDRLREYWSTFTDAWLEGGPDNPENVLIKVTGESAEYWDTPGSKVTQVTNLVKAKVTGERYEGDHEKVDLPGDPS